MAAGALAPTVAAPLRGFALLLVLHSAVLKPNLNLFLRQVQVRGDLYSSESGKIHVRGKLPFKFQKLGAGERRAHPFAILYVAALR